MRAKLSAIGACGAVLAALVLAPPALAVNADCEGADGLQQQMDDAPSGAVINMTVAACPARAFTLPPAKDLTIVGAPTAFDNATVADDVFGGATTGKLTFRDVRITVASALTNGIEIAGASDRLLVEDSALLPVHATSTAAETGGPLTLAGVTVGPGAGNGILASTPVPGFPRALFITDSLFTGVGGALFLRLTDGDVTIARNIFSGNTVTGVNIAFSGPGRRARIFDNAFLGNTRSGVGAGLAAFISGSFFDSLVEQDGNTFAANTVSGGPGDQFGAAAYYVGVNVRARGDRYTGNTTAPSANPPTTESEGGAIYFSGCTNDHTFTYRGENLVLAGNSAGDAGGGIYVGCSDGPTRLELINSTVSGNTAPVGAGIDAKPGDALLMRNSIAAGNTGVSQINGFASRDVEFSAVCPLTNGTGNICAAPILDDQGRQAATSPTRNKGSDAAVALAPGLTTDVFGGPRITEGRVDIGADEFDPPAAPADTTAPRVTRARLSRRRFAVGSRATPRSGRAAARAKKGTTISYSLSEAATASLRIDRRTRGYRVRGKCRAKRPKRASRARRCTLYRKAGTLRRTSRAGSNKVRFSGRIGKRRLRPGRYRLTIVATDLSKNKSARRRLAFRVVR